MERNIPENGFILLERWFSVCMTCVKWCNVWSVYQCQKSTCLRNVKCERITTLNGGNNIMGR